MSNLRLFSQFHSYLFVEFRRLGLLLVQHDSGKVFGQDFFRVDDVVGVAAHLFEEVAGARYGIDLCLSVFLLGLSVLQGHQTDGEVFEETASFVGLGRIDNHGAWLLLAVDGKGGVAVEAVDIGVGDEHVAEVGGAFKLPVGYAETYQGVHALAEVGIVACQDVEQFVCQQVLCRGRAEFFYFLFIATAVFLLKDFIMRLFVSGEGSEDVIAEGILYLSTMSFFYILPGMTNGIQGFFRGVGRMKTTLLCTTIQASMRVVFTFILVPHYGIPAIAYACAIGWCLMLLYEVPCYFRFRKENGLV